MTDKPQIPDAFTELARKAAQPTEVPEQLAKFVAALVNGSHEITSVTIRPKNTVLIDIIHAWQAIEETSGHLSDEGDIEGRMRISVIRKAWEDMDDLVRDAWDKGGRP